MKPILEKGHRRDFLDRSVGLLSIAASGAPLLLAGCGNKKSDVGSRPSQTSPKSFSQELATALSAIRPEHIATLASVGGQSISTPEATRLRAAIKEGLRSQLDEISLSEDFLLESWTLSEVDDLGVWLSTVLLAALGAHAGQKARGYYGAALGMRAGASLGNTLAVSLARPLRLRTAPKPTRLRFGGEVALGSRPDHIRIHSAWKQLYSGLNIPVLGDRSMPYGALLVKPSSSGGYMRVQRRNSQPYGQNLLWNPELHHLGKGLIRSALFAIVENENGIQMRVTPTDAMESHASSPEYGRLTSLLDTFGLIAPDDEQVVGLGELHFRGLELAGLTATSALALSQEGHTGVAAASIDAAKSVLARMNYNIAGISIAPLPDSLDASAPKDGDVCQPELR